MSQYCEDITKSASPGSLFADLHTQRPTCTRTTTSLFQQYATVCDTATQQPHWFPSIKHSTSQLQICGVFDDNTTHHMTTSQPNKQLANKPLGQLVDSGANINITNNLNLLSDVWIITPFNISVAINNAHTSSGLCTHRGMLQLTLNDGNTLTTACYYCPTAVETIISPQAVLASSSALCQWSQVGFRTPLSLVTSRLPTPPVPSR